MPDLVAVVLAAGHGTRMKSDLLKVLHPLAGKPMLAHVVNNCRRVRARRVILVVGYQRDRVQAYFGDAVEYAVQAEQLGTAHALMQAEPLLAAESDCHLLVVCGDNPCLSFEVLEQFAAAHRNSGAAASLLTAITEQPGALGRVERRPDGSLQKIVEYKDASEIQQALHEVSSGVYMFRLPQLWTSLRQVNSLNAQKEFYLPDVLPLIQEAGGSVEAFALASADDVVAPNDRKALAVAEGIIRRRTLERLMDSGVTVIDPASTWVGDEVAIGTDSVIYPFTSIDGFSVIGEYCQIGPGTRLVDATVGAGVSVQMSVIENSRVGDGSRIGPFAHLRAGCDLGPNNEIGNYAELKNAHTGAAMKMHHHGYVGDANVGLGVNIGAGVITCNYDGVNKHRTTLDDHTFIGTNVNLVAPIRIGGGAYVAAGSTVNRDVPPGALAIARTRQVIKPGFAQRLRPVAAQPEPDLPAGRVYDDHYESANRRTYTKGEATVAGYHNRRLKIFTGNAHRELANEISAHLGIALGDAEVGRFSNGEVKVKINESVRGADCFVIQSSCQPVNDGLMEMLIILDALRRASARRITAVMPHYGYARQDRKAAGREPISAKLVANLLTVAGARRLLSMDLHTDAIQGFFDSPVDHLRAVPLLADYFLRKQLPDACVIAPDTGGVPRARALAKRLRAGLAIIDKRRPEPNEAEVMHVVGDVAGKRCIMIDDIIDTAGTIIHGANALMERGATAVYAACTHAVFSGPAYERLRAGPFTEIVVTNTIPVDREQLGDKLTILSVAPLIGEAMIRIHEDLSVSKMFD